MKLGSYIILILSMVMFLEFVGVPTGASVIFSTFGIEINPITLELISADVESSNFFSWIFGAGSGILLIASTAGAVIVGLFAKSYDTSLVILPLIVSIGTLLASIFGITIKYVQSISPPWATAIVMILLFGIGIGLIMSCVDYFAGR
jgi:predicted outer membrane lipoprotein